MKKFIPKEEERFWYIINSPSRNTQYTALQTHRVSNYSPTFWQKQYIYFGNCFRTKKDAQEAIKQIKKTLK